MYRRLDYYSCTILYIYLDTHIVIYKNTYENQWFNMIHFEYIGLRNLSVLVYNIYDGLIKFPWTKIKIF